MTLPSSGSISTSQIQAEIGDTGSITIPDANTRTLTGKSTGALTIPNDFWGKTWGGGGGSVSASIEGRSIVDYTSGSATATYKIDPDGNVYDQTNAFLEQWLDSGTNGDFEVKATETSGSVTGSLTGSWLATTTGRSWSVSSAGGAGGGDLVSATLTVQIRNASTLSILTSATISLEAQAGGGL